MLYAGKEELTERGSTVEVCDEEGGGDGGENMADTF